MKLSSSSGVTNLLWETKYFFEAVRDPEEQHMDNSFFQSVLQPADFTVVFGRV